MMATFLMITKMLPFVATKCRTIFDQTADVLLFLKVLQGTYFWGEMGKF